MITALTYTAGFPTKLPCLAGKKLEFQPGLNVLFGPNGCGKSTIIKSLAGSLGCYKGGFSNLLGGLILQSDGTLAQRMARCNLQATDVDCLVEADGSRGFLYRGNEVTGEVASNFFFDVSDSPDGMTDVHTQLANMQRRPSHGMLQKDKLFRIIALLDDIPPADTLLKASSHASHVEKEQVALWTRNLARTKLAGEILTLLFDEPDVHLEIPLQYMILLRLLPNLANRFQVILATHNPIILLLSQAYFVSLDPAYVDLARRFQHKDLAATQELIEEYRHSLRGNKPAPPEKASSRARKCP